MTKHKAKPSTQYRCKVTYPQNSRQLYTYVTRGSSTKSRKIESHSYLMYIKDYLKKHKSYAQTQSRVQIQMVHKKPSINCKQKD